MPHKLQRSSHRVDRPDVSGVTGRRREIDFGGGEAGDSLIRGE